MKEVELSGLGDDDLSAQEASTVVSPIDELLVLLNFFFSFFSFFPLFFFNFIRN